MTHSKLAHSKTYKLKIDLKNTHCPVCGRKGQWYNYFEEIECRCGYVFDTPMKFVGGIRINTDTNLKIIKETPKW